MADGQDSNAIYNYRPDLDLSSLQAPPPPPPPPGGSSAGTDSPAPGTRQGGPPQPPTPQAFPGAAPKPSTRDRVIAGVGGFLSGFGGKVDFTKTPLGQKIMAYQKSRMDELTFRAQNMQTLEGKIATAQQGYDPDTGQKLSPQDQQAKIEEYTNQHNAEEGAFIKLGGTMGGPEVKKHSVQAKQLKDSLRNKAGQAHAQNAGAGQGGPPPPPGGPPQPPAQGAPQGAPAGGPPRPPGTALAPPVNPQSMAGQTMAGDIAFNQTVEQRRKFAQIANLQPGTRDYQEFMATGKFPTAAKLQAKNLVYPDGHVGPGSYDPDIGGYVDDQGVLVPGARMATEKDVHPSLKVFNTNGKPAGIDVNGVQIPPGGPGWTSEMQSLMDQANKTWAEAEKGKIDRQSEAYSRYAKMRGEVSELAAIDLTTGQPVFVNPNTINANRGKYGPAGVTQQLRTRAAIFGSIQTSVEFVNQAIQDMPESEWDTTSSAQLSAAMKSADPASALSLFVNSVAMKQLDQSQQNYVLGLKDLMESTMSLRTVGGIGAGSDKVRDAIAGMVPGPGTPSKSYAQTQMKRLQAEIDALHQAVPSSKSLGMGGGPPSPPSGGPPANAAEYLNYLRRKKAASDAAAQSAGTPQ